VRPVMIHQAVLGSIERFMAILLEHHRGNLPFWVVPEQIVVAPVSVGQLEYARAAAEIFHAASLRCVIDEANETLSRRIVAAHDGPHSRKETPKSSSRLLPAITGAFVRYRPVSARRPRGAAGGHYLPFTMLK